MIAQDQQSKVLFELYALISSLLRPTPPNDAVSPQSDSKVLYELCALIGSLIRSTPLNSAVSQRSSMAPARRRKSEMSPSGLAAFMLGISLALILCGSVTFVIGFILMPWVLGLVIVFYFVGLVSNLSGLGKTILLGKKNSTGSEQKEMPAGGNFHQGDEWRA